MLPIEQSVHNQLIDQEMTWVGLVEHLDEATARRVLADRLKRDRRNARETVQLPQPWPLLQPNIAKMMTRDAELVRFDRLASIVQHGDRILDVGCGHGVVACCIAQRNRLDNYLGVDISAKNVASASEMAAVNNLEGVLHFKEGDAAELDATTIAELQPNIVLLLEVLEHLVDPAATLRSMRDLLNDGALLIFSVPLIGRIEACWGHRSTFGTGGIRQLVKESGLALQHVEELHNTWALVAVSQDPSPHPELGRFKTEPVYDESKITKFVGVPVAQARVTSGDSTITTKPSRLSMTSGGNPTARLEFETPQATILRLKWSTDLPEAIEEVGIRTHDSNGRVLSSWRTARDRSRIRTEPTTFVLRPGWPTVGIGTQKVRQGKVCTTSIEFRIKGDRNPTLEIQRLAYASASKPTPPAFSDFATATTSLVTTDRSTRVDQPHTSHRFRRGIARLRHPMPGQTRTQTARQLSTSTHRYFADRASKLVAQIPWQ